MKKDLLSKGVGHLVAPVCETDKEIDNQTALRSAVPALPVVLVVLGHDATEDEKIAREIYGLEILQLNQAHFWRHVFSCFKSCKLLLSEHCRYRFPRERYPKTNLDDLNSSVLHRRLVGSEYINNYNPTLLEILRSNPDARFLIKASEEIYYAIEYSMKISNS